MKNKLLLLAMGIACTTQLVFSQGISSFSNQWYNTYSNGITQNGIGVLTRGVIDNGNLVVAGSSWPSWPSGTTDQLITKVSSNGSLIFQTLRTPGGDHDGFGAVTILDNGNYAFFGQQNAQGTQYFDGFYCVFNSNGQEQSYNFFSIPGSSSGSDMKKLPNGNLVFTGNHGGGNNYVALTNQNFNQIQYQTFNVSNNGWNSGLLAVDEVNNFIYAVGGESSTNILQIKKYDFNLNLINSYSINDTNPFKCYDVMIMNGNLWLCGYKIISNNRYATIIKMDANGIISDSNTSNSISEYTAIANYSSNVILSKSNLTGTTSNSNEISTYLGNNNFGPSSLLNSGSPFVPFDVVIDQNYVYCIGVQGENHYVGIPAIQKLKIENIQTPTYSDNCNNVSGSLTQGLVGYWPFCGNANDDSGNGNNGTVNGATLTTDRFGNSNSAYSFDGQNDYIEVVSSNSLNVTNSYTLSVWINVSQWSFLSPIDEHSIISKIDDGNWYGGYEIFTANNNGTIAHTGNIGNSNVLIASSNYSENVWYNVLLTYDGILLKMYVNGILVNSQSNSGQIQTSSIPLRFGRRGGAGFYNNWYKGKIDDIGIWNRALTPQEITQLYNANQCFTNTTVTDTLIINVGQLSYTNPISYANNITIAPNPASTQVNINFNNITDLAGGTIKIINALGQQVATTPITATGTNTSMSLDTWGGAGMYFVQIINPQGQIVDIKKIILQ